ARPAAGAGVERVGAVAGLAATDPAAPGPSGRPEQLVGVVAGGAGTALPLLETTLRARAAGHEAALRVLPVQGVRLTGDAPPAQASLSAIELLREIGPDALHFLLLLERAARPVDLDLELAKRERTDNPLFLVQYAHARLADRVRAVQSRREIDPSLLASGDVEVLRGPARWPDLIEGALRALEPDRIACFAVELASATHRWLNRHRPGDGPEGAASTRTALASCLARVFRQALALCNVSAPEWM